MPTTCPARDLPEGAARRRPKAGFPEEIAWAFTQGFAYVPGVAVTFRAEEVFLQTPGPGAGTDCRSDGDRDGEAPDEIKAAMQGVIPSTS